MAVCPFVSWSVMASFTSFAICKPFRRIHSRFPINTEYIWEDDEPLCMDKRIIGNLKTVDTSEIFEMTVSGCISYTNVFTEVFLFVCVCVSLTSKGHIQNTLSWGSFEVLLPWPNTYAQPLTDDSLIKLFSFKTHCLYTELHHKLIGSICIYLPL